MSTRVQITTAAATMIAACGLSLVLAGPAMAASGTPTSPPSPVPSSMSSTPSVTAAPSAPTLAPSTSAGTDPAISVPAGNAGVRHDTNGVSSTELGLLFAGGLVLAAGGTVLARRRG